MEAHPASNGHRERGSGQGKALALAILQAVPSWISFGFFPTGRLTSRSHPDRQRLFSLFDPWCERESSPVSHLSPSPSRQDRAVRFAGFRAPKTAPQKRRRGLHNTAALRPLGGWPELVPHRCTAAPLHRCTSSSHLLGSLDSATSDSALGLAREITTRAAQERSTRCTFQHTHHPSTTIRCPALPHALSHRYVPSAVPPRRRPASRPRCPQSPLAPFLPQSPPRPSSAASPPTTSANTPSRRRAVHLNPPTLPVCSG